MEAFATPEQYVARYGEVDDDELLEEILMDASRQIQAELEAAGIVIDEKDTDAADRRMQVCRSVTYRTLNHESERNIPFGATQFSQAAGCYSESFSMGNPYRDIYLTKAEKKLLGIGRAKIGFSIPGGVEDDI